MSKKGKKSGLQESQKKTVCLFCAFLLLSSHFTPVFSAPSSIGESGIFIAGSMGKITHSFKGESDQTLVLIQDAHSNEEAQIKISRILKHLSKKYGKRTRAIA